jgi:hypothetical protein
LNGAVTKRRVCEGKWVLEGRERERERERERWVYGGFKGRVLREGREIGGKGDHGSLVKREREKWGFDGVW